MSNQFSSLAANEALANTFIDAMARVYLWMTGGLLITAVVAAGVAGSDELIFTLTSNPILFWGIILGQFGLVLGISALINKIAPMTALALFFLYSGLMGVMLSVILLNYDLGTVGIAFGVTSGTFAGLSIVGLTTKKDLTRLGPLLMAALFGLIIASVANWFMQSGALEWLISYAGVLIFMGLTLYQTKKIKTMTFEALANGDAQAVNRIGVMGALQLYLSFINLFLFILRIVGGRR
ncbi:MAG: Bax inhibitor-1/YccA family protein [Chloroflexi bacterium]|nr:Bax inhibitor-1/YccA family protein [Chloroflexota bacterium]MCH8870076.1 Bax inhibitor-1/YccA family protein [Chloroflexota bacterium]MCH9038873.1 Bax inhibitor-1/YccA family protein [Chloroflexota bacterium]